MVLRGPEDKRSIFAKEFIEAFNALFPGEIETDEVVVSDSPSSSSTSRNEFKRAMLNHRKAVIVNQESKTEGSWKRFSSMAESHTDIETVMFGVELGEESKQFSAIANYLLLPSPQSAAASVHSAVTFKKQ